MGWSLAQCTAPLGHRIGEALADTTNGPRRGLGPTAAYAWPRNPNADDQAASGIFLAVVETVRFRA